MDTFTFTAPYRMSRRHQADSDIAAQLPTDLFGQVVEVKFPPGALFSTGYVDQLVCRLSEAGVVKVIITGACAGLGREVIDFSLDANSRRIRVEFTPMMAA